jgi:hypothetical protein
MDSFALPVQGTETRVNAQNEVNDYMVEYIQASEKVSSYTLITFSSDTTYNFFQTRERHRVVSLSSRLWILAIWYRRKHSIDKPKISRCIRCRCCAWKFPYFEKLVIHVSFLDRFQPYDLRWKNWHRSISRSYTPPNVSPSEYQGQSHWTRLKIWVFMTIKWMSQCLNRTWITTF